MLVLGDLHVAISALVSGPDLERLLAAPLTPRERLAWKLIETLPRTLPPVLGIALPVALAYAGVEGGVHPLALAAGLFALWAGPPRLAAGLAPPPLPLRP